MMNEHARQVLEVPAALKLIARYAASAPGQQAVMALAPGPSRRQAFVNRPLFTVCIALRREQESLPMIRFEPPDELLQRARPEDAVLDVDAFLDLRRFVWACRDLQTFLTGPPASKHAAFDGLRRQSSDFKELLREVDRVFDPDGLVRDVASAALQQIRRQIRSLEQQIRRTLDQILADADLKDVLQDAHVAIRNQRYVVPVRRELKSRLRGVVHDQSNSGRTLFMEPAAILEAGNELTAAKLQERDEIRRILRQLTTRVRQHAGELAENAAALTRYDLAGAVSAWANAFECHYPEEAKTPLLRDARHPLLQDQFRREMREGDLCPLELRLPAKVPIMAITGSNTGGKTVALKTIGLLAMLHQAGLPIPASPTSRLPFFSDIFADIGDEQSLEQSLSTFSAHVAQLVTILQQPTAGPALVLIDELGSGTDPLEGGALGCAVLDTLAARGATTFITTHLGAIKHYVQDHPQMVNASMRFNLDSLAPEYRLEVGRPGASYALVIAGRLQMPAAVLDRAKELLGREQLHFEEVLADLDQQQRQLETAARSAQSTRDRLTSEREDLTQELRSLRKERRKLLHQSQREAAALVENTRREMNRLLAQARRAGAGDQADELSAKLEQRQRRLSKAVEETGERPPKPTITVPLAVGTVVSVHLLGEVGKIVSLAADGERALVEVAGKNYDVPLAQLTVAVAAPAAAAPQFHLKRPPAGGPVPSELNLVGRRVDEALVEVDSLLSRAMLAGLPQLRLIHGYGTGRLRQAIHEHLTGNPAVAAFRLGEIGKDPGGSGVTMVELA